MKHSLLAFSLLALSSVAFADLGEMHAQNCETPAVKSMIGSTGSCRVVIAPKKIEKQGVCTGVFGNSLPCTVTFISNSSVSGLNLTCGNDPKTPVINQDMEAEATGYSVATLIRKADGQDVVVNDENEYSFFTNRMIDVYVVESESNGVATTSGNIVLSLQSGAVSLSNVTCR